MKEYIILEAFTTTDLEASVNKKLNEGWQLHGYIFIGKNVFSRLTFNQTMTRGIREKETPPPPKVNTNTLI